MARKPVKFNVNPLLQGPSLHERRRSGSPYREINIDEIDVDPDQPRRVFEENTLKGLADSIRENGVLCPIIVSVSEGGIYRIIAGERRYRACKMLGLKTVPALVESEEISLSSKLSKQLVENIQRENLTPMEKALAIGQLKDLHGWSVREIGSHLGISKTSVQRSLEILQLPKDLQDALCSGASESKVLLLVGVSNVEIRGKLLSRLDSLTRVEVEALVKKLSEEDSTGEPLSHGGTVGGKTGKLISSKDKRVIEDMQRALGAKVEVLRRKSNKQQGRLVIEFYSDDDLNVVYQKLIS